MSIRALNLLFLVLVVTRIAGAQDIAEVKVRSGVFQNKGGKLEKVGDLEPKEKFGVLARTAKGNWIKINYHGKVGWIPTNRVDIYPQGTRAPASVTRAPNAGYSASVQVGLLVETSSMGIGFGAGGHLPISVDLPRKMHLDAGLMLAFLPSVTLVSTSALGTSVTASAFEIMGQGRLFYEIEPRFRVGGDLGLLYRNIGSASTTVNVGTTPIAISSGGSSGSFGAQLGGLAAYNFTSEWIGIGGMRLMIASPTNLQFYAVAEYRF